MTKSAIESNVIFFFRKKQVKIRQEQKEELIIRKEEFITKTELANNQITVNTILHKDNLTIIISVGATVLLFLSLALCVLQHIFRCISCFCCCNRQESSPDAEADTAGDDGAAAANSEGDAASAANPASGVYPTSALAALSVNAKDQTDERLPAYSEVENSQPEARRSRGCCRCFSWSIFRPVASSGPTPTAPLAPTLANMNLIV